MQLKSSKVKD